MSLVAQISRDSEKHQQLELKIREELARPRVGRYPLGLWKREKLKLKDQMAKLQRTNGEMRH